MKLIYENREVIATQIEHALDFCDSYIVEAHYLDTGETLEEADLLQLTEESLDLLYEDWLDSQYAYGLVKEVQHG